MANRLRKGDVKTKPVSLKDVFSILESKIPVNSLYDYDGLVDARALRLDEKERLISLLREGRVEVRCAAAYVVGMLGIEEARPVMEKTLKRIRSPLVKYMFEFALASFDVMREYGSFPKPEEQIPMLLEMRNSHDLVVCKLTDIVLGKADIRFETDGQEEPKQ